MGNEYGDLRMHMTNKDFCEKANQMQLSMLTYGRAEVDRKWYGESTNPSFSYLYYIINGSATVETKSGILELTAGNWYLLPARCSFKYRCDTYMDHLFFHIKLCDVNRLDLLYHCREPLTATGYAPAFLFQYLEGKRNPLEVLSVQSFLYEMVLSFLKKKHITLTAAKLSLPVQNAIEYIQNNLSAQRTTTEIAENAFVSKSTLTKHFKKELSMSVQEYLYDLLLSEAGRMLLNGNCSILDISEMLGFSDQFYFSRRFKMKYGLAPREYRKRFS